MARAADAIEDEPGDLRLRPVPREPLNERRDRCARAGAIDDEHDRPADDGGKRRRRSGVARADAVEEPHRALAQHEIGRGARGQRAAIVSRRIAQASRLRHGAPVAAARNAASI